MFSHIGDVSRSLTNPWSLGINFLRRINFEPRPCMTLHALPTLMESFR